MDVPTKYRKRKKEQTFHIRRRNKQKPRIHLAVPGLATACGLKSNETRWVTSGEVIRLAARLDCDVKRTGRTWWQRHDNGDGEWRTMGETNYLALSWLQGFRAATKPG